MSEEKKDSTRPPVRNYLKQIDDFFEQTPLRNVIADLNHFFQKGNRLLTFPVDLYEVGDELVVTAELPGIQKEQIQIEIQSEYLKVSVKEDILEETEEQTSHNYYRRERSSSEASRIIKLPYLINKKTAKASYQNGVLEIRAQKLPQQHDILSID